MPNGGGFGGKEDLSVQGHAALMAYLLGRPVKVRLTRDESIRMHPKRHPMWMDYEVGCDASGKFTFVKTYIVGDTGAYASVGAKVLERAAGHATGAYHVPGGDIEAVAVYTNNVPCGAMRGFGVNQTAFAIENLIDDLCLQGGFDRWQFRYDNAIDVGSLTATGQMIEGGAGLRATLEAVKDRVLRRQIRRAGLRHQEHRHRQRHARRVDGQDHDRRPGQGAAGSRLDRDGPGRPHRCLAGAVHRDRHRSQLRRPCRWTPPRSRRPA